MQAVGSPISQAEYDRLKNQYLAMDTQMNDLIAAQTSSDKAKEMDERTEALRQKAYEDAGIPYPGNRS